MGKAWIVTYTKHIKQKRKVYQDGVLEIHGSTNKVMLYDDDGKLLECRLLRDEVVRSGETLEFNSYLVDIGDPKGSHEHLPNLNTQERNRRVNSSERITHGQKARNICTFVEKKADVGSGAPKNGPNVTKKITREYRKSELDIGEPKSHLTTTKTTMTEWHALYTTQITQKAKKYHDGFLQLSICGSQGRQVMLYDESRKLLDTRFLKKGEVIGSGETLAFNAHLVDIGDPEGNHSSLKDPNFEGEDVKVIENTGIMHELKAGHCSSVENGKKELKNSQSLQSAANDAQISVKEWNALYTKQITQKAKRFHDGILLLDFRSSHGKQVILLDEDGTKLANKYIKFSEDVRTGSNLELANYLVQIGEPRQLQGGKSEMDASLREGGVRSNCSSRITDNLVISRSTPFRDAKQILSILKKPSQESVVHTGEVPVGQSCSSHPFPLVQSSIQDQLACGFSQGAQYFDRNVADDHESDPKILTQARTTSFNMCRSDILEPKLAQDDLVVDITNLMDQNRSRSTFARSLGAEAPNTSSKFNLGYTDKRNVKASQSISKPQASDIILLDLLEDSPPSELTHPRRQVPKDAHVTLKQLHSDSIRTGTQWTKQTSFMGMASSSDSASCISTHDAERQSSEVQNTAEPIVHIGELLSFDLGIERSP